MTNMFKGLVVALLLTAPLSAHDFWIEPTTFSATEGKVVGVKLRVGQDLAGDPVPRDPAAIDQFVVVNGDKVTPVFGRDGDDPAGLIRAAGEGLLVIGYRSKPSPVTLTAEKFNQYLTEEGLDAIAAERARRGQSSAGAREVFSRAAKSLVRSGAASTGGDRALGFRLELVAEKNPYALRTGDELPVRLLYEGRPLSGVLVTAFNKYKPLKKLSARTDGQGRVRFPVDAPGPWLIKAVHMMPAAAGADAEWESIWASLTFESLQSSVVGPQSKN
jgi:uncharacterized GH25 family protein